MQGKDRIKANEKVSEQLSSDVEAFLANGGKVETMRTCSDAEGLYRSKRFYTKRHPDGRRTMYRYDHKKL